MISVIIPVYNMADKLARCLKSIREQTLYAVPGALEVIIVNDGSKDGIDQAVKRESYIFNEKNVPLKYVSQDNQGANAARNRGFSESSGEFIIFCDADVIMRPDMLDKMKSALLTNPSSSYAYSSFFWGAKKFRLWAFDAERLKQMPYITTTSLVRREYFPGFDENLKRLQDWDLWLTMLEQGCVGVWIDEPLFKIITGGTMSDWVPKAAYKFLPFLPQVKKYKDAVEIVRKKHGLDPRP